MARSSHKVTHYCSRCEEHAPLDEWSYDGKTHSWRHTRSLYGATDVDGNPIDMECGWTERVPRQVA